MEMQDTSELSALVAYGAPDVFLHANPQVSVYKQGYMRTTNSQFTFKSVDFKKVSVLSVDGEGENKYSASISATSANSDMIGQCYLEVIMDGSLDLTGSKSACDIVESVTFTAGQNVKETLTRHTLRVKSNDRTNHSKPEMETVISDGHLRRHAVIPLPFFFTKETKDYFPLIALWRVGDEKAKEFGSVTFACELDPKYAPYCRTKLIFQSVALDTDERRNRCTENLETLMTISQTTSSSVLIDSTTEDYVKHTIDLPYKVPIKDIRVLIDRHDNSVGEECVGLLNVRFNQNPTCHMSLNALMAKKIIPRRFYGIPDNVQPIYYLPFSYDPLLLTSDINFGRMDRSSIEIYLRPGTYEISLVAHGIHRLRTYSGSVVCV